MNKVLIVDGIKNIWKKLNKKWLIAVGVCIVAVISVVVSLWGDILNKGITVAEASKLICFGYYDKEYLNEVQTDGYWYQKYMELCREKGSFLGKRPGDKVTYSDCKKLTKELGVAEGQLDVDLQGLGVISKDKFLDVYMQLLPMFEYGEKIKEVEVALAGTPSNISELGEWKAYTSKGIYGFTGLLMDDKLDKQLAIIVCDDEILSVKAILSNEVIYRNIWVKHTTDNKIYTNIYGVDRVFDVKGLEESVSQVLSDIKLIDGEVESVNVKTDTISGKVLSATATYIEVEGYGKIALDRDFMIYDISDDFRVSDYQDIIVGYSLQDFIVADGNVCGAVINRNIEVDNVRVLIKSTGYTSIFHKSASVTCDTDFLVVSGDKVLEYEAGEVVDIEQDSSLFDYGRITVKPVSGSRGEIVLLDVKRSQGNPEYEGHIELSLWDEGITIVNDINVEKYLKRVVPSEMPASFGVEALKVQAVCARSYVYRQLSNKHYRQYGAHVDDSTQYQVYNNTVEYPASNEAIDRTKGLVLSYNDQIVQAYYYSTSCGVGTDVGVWGTDVSKYPYFVSRDIGSEKRNLNLKDEAVFEEFISKKYSTDYDSTLPLYRWSMRESVKEISEAFNDKLSKNYSQYSDKILTKTDGKYVVKEIGFIGDIKDIQVVKRANGGAAIEVVVTGETATVKLKSESVIRAMFGNAQKPLVTTKDIRNMDNLPSAFCVFKKLYEGEKLTGYEIIGGGYGHGIGMSQNAVKAMVNSGMKFDEVLQFFYPGTSFLE